MSAKTKPITIDDKLNYIMNQNKTLQAQVTEQAKLIADLKSENQFIMDNTLKMGKHIDFINTAYDKITKSYLFKNIFA